MGGIICCLYFFYAYFNGFSFYAIQQVAQAGWSPVLFRVMQELRLPSSCYYYIFNALWISSF
jgi:hypothetical protein